MSRGLLQKTKAFTNSILLTMGKKEKKMHILNSSFPHFYFFTPLGEFCYFWVTQVFGKYKEVNV